MRSHDPTSLAAAEVLEGGQGGLQAPRQGRRAMSAAGGQTPRLGLALARTTVLAVPRRPLLTTC